MPSTSTSVLLSQNHQKFHHDRTAKIWTFRKGQEIFAQNFNGSPRWLARHVLEGIDALSFLIKLQDERVIQHHQEHMRVCLCFSEPMSPTLVNHPDPEQMEWRFQSRNQLLQCQPHCDNLPKKLKYHNQMLRYQFHRNNLLKKSGQPNVSVSDKVWIWREQNVMYKKLGSYCLWGSTGHFQWWSLKAMLDRIIRLMTPMNVFCW